MDAETPAAALNTTPDQPDPSLGIEHDRKHHRDILNELIDIGAAMARMVARQASRHDDSVAEPPTENLTVAYERCARAVRRSIMLYEKLVEPPKPARHRVVARRRIIRDVEDAIERNAPADEQENLHAELLERLDSPDLDNEIATRTAPEIVTDICRDLGIAHLPAIHPWKRRIPHDIAVLNARAEQPPAAAPSEKLAALLASAPPRPVPIFHSPIDPDKDIAKLSDEELEALLNRVGPGSTQPGPLPSPSSPRGRAPGAAGRRSGAG
jgi:hypothetical protein